MLAKTHTPHSEDSAIPVSMDGHRLIHTNGTLLLRAVKAEDSGYYTCTATNTGGFDTIIVNLLVQGEPCKAGGARVGAGMEKGKKFHHVKDSVYEWKKKPYHQGDQFSVEQRCQMDEQAGGAGRMSRSEGST